MVSQRFSGKTVLVTGAALGIGRAIADSFCSEGANVYGFDVDDAGLTAAKIANGTSFNAITSDVSILEQIEAGVSRVLRESGRVDIIINNAGINMAKRLSVLDEVDWDRVMDVNLKSAYLMTKTVWSTLVNQRSGVIVNISSIMGQVGGVGAPAYCAAKAGMIMLSRCIAKDGARYGIRSNCVCPGYVDTPIMDRVFAAQSDPVAARAVVVGKQPLGRFALPDEIARGILFLASSDADYISGSELTIDGAFTATQIDG
jgi:NAD(P)-dependent dehydrogenase (short-subunit alcohol dehydrogenase family)